MADLQKAGRSGRSPEDEVRIIAEKFPEMSGAPSAYHGSICASELLGRTVALNERIRLANGRLMAADGHQAVIYEMSEEEDAFRRWQRAEFREIERLYAAAWRAMLFDLDLRETSEAVKRSDIPWTSCKNLADTREVSKAVWRSDAAPEQALLTLMQLAKVPQNCWTWVYEYWQKAGSPPIAEYAPYCSHIMEVDFFFAIALAAGLLADSRASNRIDIAYLYYLPFCHAFVSSDRLHKQCAHLFLRPEQEFVWGPDLKQGLRNLNLHYAQLPEEIRDKGIMSFAPRPPTDDSYLVTAIWDRHLPAWRHPTPTRMPSITAKELGERLRRFEEAPPVAAGSHVTDDDLEMVVRRRMVKRQKGRWHQIPKDYP